MKESKIDRDNRGQNIAGCAVDESPESRLIHDLPGLRLIALDHPPRSPE